MEEVLNKAIKNIYFLGIGGIGMSALARYFNVKGYRVAGYDKTPSVLTSKMQLEEGIAINYRDDVIEIAPRFYSSEDTLVVYTPAIPASNSQLCFFKEKGFELRKRAEVLGMISRLGKALCVAGTHGKTTVSTMIAFLLHHSSIGCNAFMGGISVNFGTNLLLHPTSPYIVIEADEYDRSFLHLTPELAVITSMDEDHLDIYGDKKHLTEAFESFAGKVAAGGRIYIREGLSLENTVVSGYYGVDVVTDCYADNVRIVDGRYVFDYHAKNVEIKDLLLGVPGRLNVENAVAAITLALEAGVQSEEIRKALPQFKGILRRFNIHVNTDDCIFIDDYAHHPREIEATLSSVREMWPHKRMTVIFQPHLFSRTKDFYPGFAEALSLADEVILLDIYPARELPIEGITSEIICERLTVPGRILSKEELLKFLAGEFCGGLLVTMGAGDIDKMKDEIVNCLELK